jgi:hypothetical protein
MLFVLKTKAITLLALTLNVDTVNLELQMLMVFINYCQLYTHINLGNYLNSSDFRPNIWTKWPFVLLEDIHFSTS